MDEKSPIINIVCSDCGEYYSEMQGHKCDNRSGKSKFSLEVGRIIANGMGIKESQLKLVSRRINYAKEVKEE